MTPSPKYKAFVKAIKAASGAPGYQKEWISAFRGGIEFYDDRIAWGEHVVRADEVSDAVVYKTKQWFIPVTVLQVSTEDGTWQFGFNPWVRVADHLPFAFHTERVRLRYSAFSIVARIVLVVLLLLWLYRLVRSW